MVYARDNPFRSERIEALPYRWRGIDPDALVEQLLNQGGRGSLVGPKGSGKTTLLYELAEGLRKRGYVPRIVRLNSDCRRLAWHLLDGMDSKNALLLDGAEQLGWVAWLRVRHCARHIPCFVTTSHRRPHLPLLHRHDTSRELLYALDAELVPGRQTDKKQLDELFDRHVGNIRDCLQALYDCWAIQS